MAELFSLMLESTSCKNDSVEATRSLAQSISHASLRRTAFAMGEISRDTRRARFDAWRVTDRRFALEMTLDLRLVSFRARASDAYRVVRATLSGRDRERISPSALAHLSIDCAASSVEEDGPSALGGNLSEPRQGAQKTMTEKAARTNPLSQNRQRLQGVYFLSH